MVAYTGGRVTTKLRMMIPLWTCVLVCFQLLKVGLLGERRKLQSPKAKDQRTGRSCLLIS